MPTFSQRLLPVLQLTRMALVFTALADSLCELLIWAGRRAELLGKPLWPLWHITFPGQCLALVLVSVGLYGFGMSLNDIIDQRRDRQISPHRPLPSGRIGVRTAHVVCALLILMALAGGEVYSAVVPSSRVSLLLVFITAGLIVFYDYAAKYLVPVGLLSLGLIRFFHAAVVNPVLPVFWHPLLLMNHVTIVSTIAYHWEQKRPALRPAHWWSVGLGLVGMNLVAIGFFAWRRHVNDPTASLKTMLALQPALLGPLVAAGAFVLLAIWIRRTNPAPRDAGSSLMLAGLLWLIVYDATFVLLFVGMIAGMILLVLLPIACAAVVVMRWWSKLVLLSQRPEFKRVET